jgi:hypothetical protein
MRQLHTLFFRVTASVLVGGLIGACVIPPAQSTEAPIEATSDPQGTAPGFPTIVVEQVVTNPRVIALLASLTQRHIVTELLDASRVELLRDAPGQAYRISDGWLHLHVYVAAQAAHTAAAGIRDAMLLPQGDWVAPPHFFQCGPLIALYLGPMSV